VIQSEEEAQVYCASRVGAGTMERMERFTGLLLEENSRQNLVANGTLPEVWRRHIADSVQLLDHVPRETPVWLDLGSGAGFPGLIIAMARPDAHVVLVESRKLRAEWLERVSSALGIGNVEVIAKRLEAVGAVGASAISARAFAPLTKLFSISRRFSTQETFWVLPKGRSAPQELSEQSPAVQKMFHVEPSLTDPSAGIIIGRGVPEVR